MSAKTSVKIPIIYSESYYVDIGSHIFPTSKYRILRKRIDEDEFVREKSEVVPPQNITIEDIKTVHTDEYIEKLTAGTLSADEVITLEVPFSSALVKAFITCCGGTLRTGELALTRGAAIHLGGGFHHAFPDHGEGFCLLNDVAVSIRCLQKRGRIKKALIIDCDLHQGNGTAFIFRSDESVYTFSIHQENNYPFYKPKSDMDIGLKDFTSTKEYLGRIYDNIPKIIYTFKPEIILYLAGADPFAGDQLGSLSVSKKGLRERDNFIINQARSSSVPIAITLAGGYAARRDDTVEIHFATVEECVRVFT